MDSGIYTNANLLKYWKLVRGTTKTRLTLMEMLKRTVSQYKPL